MLSAFILAACWQTRGRGTLSAPLNNPGIRPFLTRVKPNFGLLALICFQLFTLAVVFKSPSPANAELAANPGYEIAALAEPVDTDPPPPPESTSDPTETPAAVDPTQASSPMERKPDSSKKPFTYEVQPGDTLSQIAFKFGVSSDTMIALNGLGDPNRLSVGGRLLVPGVPGVVHRVVDGEGPQDIASTYGVTVAQLTEANDLADPPQLKAGQRLVIPEREIVLARTNVSSRGGARSLEATSKPAESGGFIWPATGPITTYFYNPGHRGIDIAADHGTPIYASDGGVVITAVKVNYDYGWHLIIDHGNGYQSLYSHLSAFYVDHQEKVTRGQKIGAIGNTGLSFGPHLHFEIHHNGTKVNPLNLLP